MPEWVYWAAGLFGLLALAMTWKLRQERHDPNT